MAGGTRGGSNPARSVPTIVCRDWFCYPLCCFPSLPLSPSFLGCLGFVLCFYFFLSKCPQFEHLKSKQATFMPLTCAFSVSVCCTRTYVCVRLTAIWSLSLKFCNMPSTSHGYFYDYHTLWSQAAGATPQPKNPSKRLLTSALPCPPPPLFFFLFPVSLFAFL